MSIDIRTAYSEIAVAPTVTWGDSAAHAHTVQFYGDDAFLLDELSRFIGSALEAGDASIVIATKEHRDELAMRLKARGLDIAHIVREGRYVSLDAAETLSKFMVEGWPDEARFTELIGGTIAGATLAARGDYPRVAAFGEMVALLWAEGKSKAAIRLEELWNGLAQTHAFNLRCAYPTSFFGRSEDSICIEEICATHSHVLPDESYTSLTTDAARLHAIAILQQKAQALEAEVEERKKTQQALREANQELREAIAARDEFLSVAAHELKTPITSLRGFAQLLLRDARRNRESSPERIESALSAIETQTGKLTHLLSRLLDTAQIKAGKLRIEPERTDLVALVRSALALQHGTENHDFAFYAPEHIEALVDPLRLEQVVTNLLDNAVKFSPHGGSVTVELGQDAEGGIELSVTDQGLGIPFGEREGIFDRFHQAHDGHHLSGMGLGLYIIREIVELHGGSVRIEGTEQSGSRFVVSLPPSVSV
ncbi:MAG TPA: ATP-binding protein [Chloroflexia bacterium]|nr:ATP-binding protein [Chloroflexia bacterium]